MFEEIFQSINAEQLQDNVFKLVGKDFFVLTSGNKDDYNSMVASGGGFGMFMKKPCSWVILASGRYTLEYIEKEKTYTLSFFEEKDREKMMFLGSKTGKNTNKMKENKLSYIVTPNGNISYAEASLIIECSLVQCISTKAEDFTSEEIKNYLEKMYINPEEIRKYLIGEITAIWKKK